MHTQMCVCIHTHRDTHSQSRVLYCPVPTAAVLTTGHLGFSPQLHVKAELPSGLLNIYLVSLIYIKEQNSGSWGALPAMAAVLIGCGLSHAVSKPKAFRL